MIIERRGNEGYAESIKLLSEIKIPKSELNGKKEQRTNHIIAIDNATDNDCASVKY